ncbi:hypothetical protein Cob_v003816 [Colletotrichum orbiculare MAFF 240422]|uniref:Uncharacterized protein n=1 Tax=Colletotrichum orbiculare (strain 104-T / ATCC 96160 / CBS 514.97 / LARS 414 / MAFF 240422) TaxID=1213857 RepID=A0A484FZF0_COLOR|nr:hypothetical protein Cob_v003816 [Colletotrichum orbiculare MAFF 240422]
MSQSSKQTTSITNTKKAGYISRYNNPRKVALIDTFPKIPVIRQVPEPVLIVVYRERRYYPLTMRKAFRPGDP